MSQLWIYTDDNSPNLVYEANSNWTVISKSETGGGNGTQSSLTYLGSRGILAEFNSTGTHVDVIGAIVLDEDTNKRLMLAFTLDGSTPAISVPTSAQNGTVATLFKSPRLSNDSHTLQLAVIEVDESAYDNIQTVQVHYVPVHQGSIYTDAANATSSNPAPEGKSTVPVGPIVGGVVGGVALLVASVLAVYFLFIKPKRKNTRPYVYYSANLDDIDSEKPSIIPDPTPFTLTKSEISTAPLLQSAALFSPLSTVTSPRSVDDVAAVHFVPYAPARSISHASTASVPASVHLSVVNTDEDLPQGPPGLERPLSVAERKAREAGTRSSSLEIHQHRDSGYRFAAAGEASGSGSSSSTAAAGPSPIPDEVPPEYSAA